MVKNHSYCNSEQFAGDCEYFIEVPFCTPDELWDRWEGVFRRMDYEVDWDSVTGKLIRGLFLARVNRDFPNYYMSIVEDKNAPIDVPSLLENYEFDDY